VTFALAVLFILSLAYGLHQLLVIAPKMLLLFLLMREEDVGQLNDADSLVLIHDIWLVISI